MKKLAIVAASLMAMTTTAAHAAWVQVPVYEERTVCEHKADAGDIIGGAIIGGIIGNNIGDGNGNGAAGAAIGAIIAGQKECKTVRTHIGYRTIWVDDIIIKR